MGGGGVRYFAYDFLCRGAVVAFWIRKQTCNWRVVGLNPPNCHEVTMSKVFPPKISLFKEQIGSNYYYYNKNTLANFFTPKNIKESSFTILFIIILYIPVKKCLQQQPQLPDLNHNENL